MTTRITGVTDRLCARIQSRSADTDHDTDHDAGMVTSEYAMGTLVAAGCVGMVYKVVTSPPILEVVKQIIIKALKLNF